MGQGKEIKDFYKRQISFTEWFEAVAHPNTVAMRLEDNEKRERLRVLNEIIGLPFDRPEQFEATDISERTPAFEKFLKERGDELWALRLIPKEAELPKLRLRGLRPAELIEWFKEQDIEPVKYRADFVPHPGKLLWSTTFVLNSTGMYGEIIQGSHSQLTQGFHEEGTPITFAFDFSNRAWKFSEINAEAKTECGRILESLKVDDVSKQDLLREKLDVTFANDYICGYLETVTSEAYGLWFIDYNRVLGAMYKDFSIKPQTGLNAAARVLKGQTGNPGKAAGLAEIVFTDRLSEASIREGEILVCDMTTPEHISLMKSAGAIVTDLGGILSHAAIVARELKKPCIVGTGNATVIIKKGDELEVDADKGLVTIL